jgi:FKBP-type peptidyl-prolyl cis-trans isomerase
VNTSIRPLRIALALMALVALVALAGCGSKSQAVTDQPASTTAEQPAEQQAAPAAGTPTSDVTKLEIKDLKKGTGAEAVDGKLVTVNYTGWLTDGTKFDSSLDSGQPFQFTLGAGQVIAGWDQGVKGMKVGGKRKLTIPPDLGYGPQGNANVIPPNATLVFEVELLGVQ